MATCSYWKESPPELVHRELNKIFQNGFIEATNIPKMMRLKNFKFMVIMSRTFAANFRKTKVKYILNHGEQNLSD